MARIFLNIPAQILFMLLWTLAGIAFLYEFFHIIIFTILVLSILCLVFLKLFIFLRFLVTYLNLISIGIQLVYEMLAYILVHESIYNLYSKLWIGPVLHQFLLLLVEYHQENILSAHSWQFNHFLDNPALSLCVSDVSFSLILNEFVNINSFLAHYYIVFKIKMLKINFNS